MLGKYIKNEFKDTSKIMLMMYSIIIIFTLLGKLYITQIINKSGGNDIVSGFLMLIYVLGIFASTIIGSIYLIVNFYQTMFGDTGYLTHTLPLKRNSIINVKILVFFVWTLILMILAVESVLILTSAGTGITELHRQIVSAIQMHDSSIIVHIIFFVVLSLLSTILEVMFCFSVGQISNKHKIGFAILTYVALYFLKQIISIVLLVSSGYMFESAAHYTGAEIVNMFKVSSYIILTASCLIYYIGTLYVCNKKLNLK